MRRWTVPPIPALLAPPVLSAYLAASGAPPSTNVSPKVATPTHTFMASAWGGPTNAQVNRQYSLRFVAFCTLEIEIKTANVRQCDYATVRTRPAA